MFAMFHLGRPDVFPLGDLAVRKGLQELYKLKVCTASIASWQINCLHGMMSHAGKRADTVTSILY